MPVQPASICPVRSLSSERANSRLFVRTIKRAKGPVFFFFFIHRSPDISRVDRVRPNEQEACLPAWLVHRDPERLCALAGWGGHPRGTRVREYWVTRGQSPRAVMLRDTADGCIFASGCIRNRVNARGHGGRRAA